MRRTPVLTVGAVLAALAAAAPAAADPLLVLHPDGRVVAREDRFLPAPDPLPRRPASPASARGRAAAARPSVARALRDALGAGTIDQAAHDRYRDAYDDARRTLRRLRGRRRLELRAVVLTVESLAAQRRFLPSRLPALFLTLARNRAWWGAAPLPRPSQRVSFSGSRLVWQYYPGQGLQVQWLGTFGKANGLFQSTEHDPELRELLDEAGTLATQRAGGLAWEYLFKFDRGRPPWVSGMANATAAQALSRAAVRLGEPRFFELARAALGVFRTPPPEGVRVDTPAGAHYLLYSFWPGLRVLNGFVQAVNGLHDFAALANDDEGRTLFAAGEAQLRAELPGYDTGAWSLYSQTRESDLGYHRLVRDFLRGLCQRLEADEQRAQRAQTGGAAPLPPVPDRTLYCETAERFTAYLRRPPAVEIEPTTHTARARTKLRFTLSKVSHVRVTLARRGRVILVRRARLGRGRYAIAFRPAKAGPLVARVSATDLAGNRAGARETLRVRPARR